MNDNNLTGWLYILGQPSSRIRVSFTEGQSASAAFTSGSVQGLEKYLKPQAGTAAVRVSFIMSMLGLTALPYRYLAFVPDTLFESTLEELRSFLAQADMSVAAFLSVPASPIDESVSGAMLFLDATQYIHLRYSLGVDVKQIYTLATYQTVEAETVGKWPVARHSDLPKPYLVQPLKGISTPKTNRGTLQAYPLNELPPDLVSNKAQHVCFLNPYLRSRWRRTYVSLSHPGTGGILNELQLSISAVPVFTDAMPQGRVGIHETLLKSIGVRPGEHVVFDHTRTFVPRLESRVFGFRQAIARVGYSHSVDVGYAVARIPDRLLDVLGIDAGQTVVVQGLKVREGPRARPARIRVRALPMRESDEDSPAFRGLRAELGVEDIQIVGLDLLRRQDLAVQPGTPIVIRPALPSLLAQEVLPISLAFATAIIGGVAQSQPIVVGIVSILFIVFVIALLLRRFR